MIKGERGFTPLQTLIAHSRTRRFVTGFTLVEVIVALMVILVAATGVLASFIAAKRYTVRANHRIIAMNLARQKLEILRAHMRQDTWDSGNLSVGSYSESLSSESRLINGTRGYQVQAVSDKEYRRVIMNITWDESEL